ncbi:MAG: DNA-binding transcriptional LysR family regulator [Myxococcota bacterium]|jgi:DNA-binding transcriptional LysR family regulator
MGDRLTQMEAFVRVVDAGGFSAAARTWGRSKAVVSKYVAQLEGRLGVALLRRTTRSLSVTDAGRAYRLHCVQLLDEVEAVEATLREEHVALSGSLRFTAPPALAERYGRILTTDFLAKHPGMTIELDLTHRMVDLVEEGLDLAIRVTEPTDSSLVARRLAPAPVILVASTEYLQRRGTPLTPTDLSEHDCLVDTNFRNAGRWRFRADSGTETVDVTGPVRVNSPTITHDLALAGMGVAAVPEFVAAAALRDGRLVEILAGSLAFNWAIYALFPRRRYLPGRVRAFIEHLAEALQPPSEQPLEGSSTGSRNSIN